MNKKQSIANTVSAEWVKFTTVRSTVWVLLATAVILIGFAALVAGAVTATWDSTPAEQKVGFDSVSTSLAGVSMAQIAIGVLGILMVTSEYSNRMITTTFAATPRRLRVALAKAAVFVPLVLALSLVCSFLAYFLGQAIFAAEDLDQALGDPGVLRAVIGAAVYLTLVGLIGIALGFLLRNTAAAISALVVTFFVLPILSIAVPDSWQTVLKYLPSNAGSSLMAVVENTDLLSPITGGAVLAIWAVGLFAIGAFSLTRRDA